MSDRWIDDASKAGPGESEIARDLGTLARESHHEIPTLDESLDTARRRLCAAPRWKEMLMSVTTASSRRPWLAAAAVALVVLAVAFFPVSWERTVGHDVALTLTNVHDTSHAADLAREMKSVLGDQPVSVRAMAVNDATTLTFATYVPAGSGVDAATRSRALAAGLRARGYDAQATATPRREHVAGPMYAMATDLVIRVETDGKTAAQIESEVRQRLAEAGLTNTSVSVTDQGTGREVKITQTSNQPGQVMTPVQLQLTKDGAPMDPAKGISIQMKRTRTNAGETLNMQVTAQGRTANVSVDHVDTIGDAAIQAAIVSQLNAQGLNLDVTVAGGQVSVKAKQ